MARASKISRAPGGKKMKSARAKIGGPCSQAMSDWKTTGMTAEIAKVLGECRSKAYQLKRAGGFRAAGKEARAQAIEHRVGSGGPVTAKDRLARAKQLRASRANVADVARTAPHRLETAKSEHMARSSEADRPAVAKIYDRGLREAGLTYNTERARRQRGAEAERQKQRHERLTTHRQAQGKPSTVLDRLARAKQLMAERAAKRTTAAEPKPSLREQHESFRASRGNREHVRENWQRRREFREKQAETIASKPSASEARLRRVAAKVGVAPEQVTPEGLSRLKKVRQGEVGEARRRLAESRAKRAASKRTAPAPAAPKPTTRAAGRGTEDRLNRAAAYRLDRAMQRSPGAKNSFVRLADLRARLGGTRQTQDAMIRRAQMAESHSLDRGDGRFGGLTPTQREASIRQGSEILSWIANRRDHYSTPERGTGKGKRKRRSR